jgi:glycosyltransferase involved in cell wall biosynthesis
MNWFFNKRQPVATVAFNMIPRRGPYGGGNQWLSQLSSYLKRCGYAVQFHLDEHVDCVTGTHTGLSGRLAFSYEDVLRAKAKNPRLVCIQRINDNDVRKGTDAMDRMLAGANRAADYTVFVSEWLRDYHDSRWFDAAKPHSVILNGADPSIFHPLGAAAWREDRPLRLVTHHWSDNMSKGFDLYQKIDTELASGELQDVELWVIGRWPAKIEWRKARTFPPCVGRKLADLLRQCHGYVTASRHEPGAMHPVEGLQCGLPLLYHRETGGTVELGRKYGMELSDDTVAAIVRFREGYDELRQKVLEDPPSGDAMCLTYRRLIQRLIAEARRRQPEMGY